ITSPNGDVDSFPIYLKVRRSGTKITLSRSSDGATYSDVASLDIVPPPPPSPKNNQIVLKNDVLTGLVTVGGTDAARAVFGDGSGPSFGQSTPPPAKPTGVKATAGDASVTVTWNANSEADLQGYNVFRDGAKVNATLVTATTYTDSGLTNGTQYCYTVR